MARRLIVLIGATAITLVAPFGVAPLPRALAAPLPQTRFVDPAGSDAANDCVAPGTPCATLGHALTQVGYGDTVQLEPGTYMASDNPPGTSNTITAQSLTIQSDPVGGTAANTIIDATGEARGLSVTTEEVAIRNLTIRNADRDGIYIASMGGYAYYAFISGNIIRDNNRCRQHPGSSNCGVPDATVGYGAGIFLADVADFGIETNVVTGNDTGIYVAATDSTEGVEFGVRGSIVSDNFGSGIVIDSTHGYTAVYITSNIADRNGGAGILLQERPTGGIIYQCRIGNNQANDNGLPGIAIHTPRGGDHEIGGNVLRNDGLRGGLHGGPGDAWAGVTHTTGIVVVAVAGPNSVAINANTISGVFYGIWLSSATRASTSGRFSVKPGGSNVFREGADRPTIAGMAANPEVPGYWLTAGRGDVFGYGFALPYGSPAGSPLARPIVGMAPTPSGSGYWLFAGDGGIFSYGNAAFHGSTGAIRLNRPIVGMASTPSGDGYWLVAADGGIFSYGDAAFYGSTGAIRLNKPIVGMAATPTGHGYWLVAADGGIFAFGDAPFYGSTGAIRLNQPIVGMAATATGHGYWFVASDGGIFAFGDAAFYGSTGSIRLNQPIVGMAASSTGRGYWFVASDAGLFSFGDAFYFGSLGAGEVPPH